MTFIGISDLSIILMPEECVIDLHMAQRLVCEVRDVSGCTYGQPT